MPIIFSTIPTSIPVSRPDQPRVFFQAPDDALLASVVAEVASILGRHQAYVFHEPSEVPAGRTPVVLNCRSDPPPCQPVSFEQVQRLRDATDSPLATCRQALLDTGGDHDRALALMHRGECFVFTGKAGTHIATGTATREMATDSDARLWVALDGSTIWED